MTSALNDTVNLSSHEMIIHPDDTNPNQGEPKWN